MKHILTLTIGLLLGIGLSSLPSVTASGSPDSSDYQYSLYSEPDGTGDIFIETVQFAPGLTRRQMIIAIGHATEKGGGALIGQGSTSSTERITSCNASTYDGYNYWYNLPKMNVDN